ncbi:MAG: 16S rRNA (guanine(527)-N(7))-methyltransferase RsmG [Gammaproteobacteria bacterium]|nr:16S rRNA (guanine(527)-N(7))-methyltransferase RsmG [Gammaproteobacteria bacterium]
MSASIKSQISAGLQQLAINHEAAAVELLDAYLALLYKWNKRYNLTAIKTPEEAVTQHILDSASIIPYLAKPLAAGPSRLLDVGTGAGLPGLVLAVLCPDNEYMLLDSNGKKIRFLRQVIIELGLTGVQVLQQRVEDVKSEDLFDTITVRAFSRLAELVKLCGPLLTADGRILAMKGAVSDVELDGLPAGFEVVSVDALEIPGLNAQRHLVQVARVSI